MAFTGTAVIELVSDGLVRITGLSLAVVDEEGASGTIGLHESAGTPNVRLPAGFMPREYKNGEAQDVSLQASVQVSMVPATSFGTAVPVSVVKTGTSPADFQIELTNDSGANNTPGLEIYVRYH